MSKEPAAVASQNAAAQSRGHLVASTMRDTWGNVDDLEKVATETIKRTHMDQTTALVAMSYLDRIAPKVAEMKAALKGPAAQGDHALASDPLLDGRKALVASLMLAHKYQNDVSYLNKDWAKASDWKAKSGGAPGAIKEINETERALLEHLDYSLKPQQPNIPKTPEEIALKAQTYAKSAPAQW